LAVVAAKYEELKKLGVEVLTISVDSPFVHKIWQENELSKMVQGGVFFPILSDTTLKPGPDLVGRVWEVWKVENAE